MEIPYEKTKIAKILPVADPEILSWGCERGVQPNFQEVRSDFLPIKYTKNLFFKGAPAHPSVCLGPPLNTTNLLQTAN
ncbi:hypothetical protein Hanom_Chr06g00575831 [Helianthus anomalus]